jgi:toxin ParE1/3/4
MRPKRFLLTRRARRDIEEITAFIARDDPARALSFADELLAACRSAAEFPGKGRIVPELRALGVMDVREIIHGNYRLVYHASGESVVFIHIFHAARMPRLRDMEKRFEAEE